MESDLVTSLDPMVRVRLTKSDAHDANPRLAVMHSLSISIYLSLSLAIESIDGNPSVVITNCRQQSY